MKSQIRIRPLREGELPELKRVADSDNHAIIAATYVVEKEQEMVGYLGLVPSTLVWMHTKKTTVRDSILLMNTYENLVSANGGQIIAVPCDPKSPYLKYMPEAGYVDTNLKYFLKNLNP